MIVFASFLVISTTITLVLLASLFKESTRLKQRAVIAQARADR